MSLAFGDRLFSGAVRAPSIVLSTVVFGSVSLLGSLADRRGAFQHRCARVWSRFVLRFAGVRLRVEGLESLRLSGPCILCANHQSDMDIPVLLAALPFQFRFAAKKSLFSVPFLGWHLRRAGHVPIDRDHPRVALRALTSSVGWVRSGLPVVVFPEGRVSQDGTLAEFKRGAFLLAERSGAGLVPVTIQGARDVLRPSSWIVRPGEVTVTIGDVISSASLDLAEMRLVVRERILAQGASGAQASAECGERA